MRQVFLGELDQFLLGHINPVVGYDKGLYDFPLIEDDTPMAALILTAGES